MLKQVQQMQKQMMAAQEELAHEIVEASAGGGMVTVKANGKQEVLEIKIDKEAVDPSEVEMLEDMVLAAVREALSKSSELAQQKLGGLTGGLNIPGM
ncbi:MAG: YbaB/EbfC family nucleoid-associated protein [Actinobacteria bacterium]|nr:MAG: YbaB/EbfC family nucleoid-associated protein [Actinomycetota bacterium]